MTVANKYFQAWARSVSRSLLAAGRIDQDELRELLEGKLDGVDPTRNAVADPDERDASTPDPVTPLERLIAEVGVARDFREAGKGKKWDRCREYDPDVYGWPKNKERGQSLGVRRITLVDTIVLHTAACDLHVDRALGVPCHALVADNGDLALCHELDAYLAAAHRLSSYSVSLEISGTRTIQPHQIAPARAWIRYAVEELRRRHRAAGVGLPIKIVPHRCGHWSRAVDCDPAIWREVAEPSIDELDLEVGDVVGSGKPIPREWWTPDRPEAVA